MTESTEAGRAAREIEGLKKRVEILEKIALKLAADEEHKIRALKKMMGLVARMEALELLCEMKSGSQG